jgi:hypothetical protein
MSDVQFEETDILVNRSFPRREAADSKVTGLLIKSGLAKDKTQANYIMLIAVVVFIVLTLTIFSIALTGGPTQPTESDLLDAEKAGSPGEIL